MKNLFVVLGSFLVFSSSSQAIDLKECANFDGTVKLTINQFSGGPARRPGDEQRKTQLVHHDHLVREEISYFGTTNPQIQGTCQFQINQEETLSQTRKFGVSTTDSWMKIQFCLNDATNPAQEFVLVCRHVFQPHP